MCDKAQVGIGVLLEQISHPSVFSMVCSLQQLRWSKVDTLGWKHRRRQDPRAHQPLNGNSATQDQHHPHAPHAMPPEKQPQSPRGQMPHGDPVTSTRRMSSAEMSSTFCSTCSTSLVSSSTSILPRYATPSPLGQNQGQASDPGVPSPWLRPVFASKGLCCRGRRSGKAFLQAPRRWRAFGQRRDIRRGLASGKSQGQKTRRRILITKPVWVNSSVILARRGWWFS